ncbi:Aspartokinase [Candidatus Johnevansia muelleri]|uniref:Aspartokinase n=1 Tax=Candidatus Johnevansia muelleri TaxID=1495769 RepID=A0A078KE84_9GAMM|nr:Aspartokinase [Candidatus Evansia muelleri]
MSLYIQKFGGTSVSTLKKIKTIVNNISNFLKNGHKIVLVISAMSGDTNRLIRFSKKLNKKPTPREIDMLVSTGEQITISLITIALNTLDIEAISYTGPQLGILTSNNYTCARINNINLNMLHNDLNENKVIVVAGFQGINILGNITTLGRGGSDTTAVALSAALQAKECQIYTDVEGIYTTDPRVCTKAKYILFLTVEEMLELSSLGSKVLQIRSIEYAGKYNVKLRVLSSFNKNYGTLIIPDYLFLSNLYMENPMISGIAFNINESKITVCNIQDIPGMAYKIIKPISNANINIDMIIQNISNINNITDFTFTIEKNDFIKSYKILKKKVVNNIGGLLNIDEKITKISLVGVGMKSQSGVASHMFNILGNEGINIRMISTSEIKISILIDDKYLEKAICSLHTAFGLNIKQIIQQNNINN